MHLIKEYKNHRTYPIKMSHCPMFPIFRRGNVPVISSNDVVQDRQDGHHANLWNVLIHCEDDIWLDTGRDNRSH